MTLMGLADFDHFWKHRHAYEGLDLMTESPHPKTVGLAEMAQDNLNQAFHSFFDVDMLALDCLKEYQAQCDELASVIRNVLQSNNVGRGGRVFIMGCGASGRIGLLLEKLWREQCAFASDPENLGPQRKTEGASSLQASSIVPTIYAGFTDQIIGYMSGGDVAAVVSQDGFEDYPELAGRQLTEMGFQSGDLLIGITASGETPYVLETITLAGRISAEANPRGPKPWLIISNTEESVRHSTRVKDFLDMVKKEDLARVQPICVGSMALTGSTRLQAATAHTIFIGAALLHCFRTENTLGGQVDLRCSLNDDLDVDVVKIPSNFNEEIQSLKTALEELDSAPIAGMTSREAHTYQGHGLSTYMVSEDLALTTLSDTVERSPTFSLKCFENRLNPMSLHKENWALCCLTIERCNSSEEGWKAMLGRNIRTIEWPEHQKDTGRERLLGFDISTETLSRRSDRTPHMVVRITNHPEEILFECYSRLSSQSSHEMYRFSLPMIGLSVLGRQVLLKMVLNAHSTIVMGRIQRYQSNVMTFVAPTNNKLIDRAIRYVLLLLRQKKVGVEQNRDIKDAGSDSMHTTLPTSKTFELYDYDNVALWMKEAAQRVAPTESIVLATYNAIASRTRTKK